MSSSARAIAGLSSPSPLLLWLLGALGAMMYVAGATAAKGAAVVGASRPAVLVSPRRLSQRRDGSDRTTDMRSNDRLSLIHRRSNQPVCERNTACTGRDGATSVRAATPPRLRGPDRVEGCYSSCLLRM